MESEGCPGNVRPHKEELIEYRKRRSADFYDMDDYRDISDYYGEKWRRDEIDPLAKWRKQTLLGQFVDNLRAWADETAAADPPLYGELDFYYERKIKFKRIQVI